MWQLEVQHLSTILIFLRVAPSGGGTYYVNLAAHFFQSLNASPQTTLVPLACKRFPPHGRTKKVELKHYRYPHHLNPGVDEPHTSLEPLTGDDKVDARPSERRRPHLARHAGKDHSEKVTS